MTGGPRAGPGRSLPRLPQFDAMRAGRSRLAFAIARRQTMASDRPALLIRVASLAALGPIFLVTPDRLRATLLSVPAVCVCLLSFRLFLTVVSRVSWIRGEPMATR